MSINTNDDYDEDDDEDECDDFFLDYCAPDDDALLTRITRGDDHTAERYGLAIVAGVLRTDGGVLRRGLGGCGNFGTFFSISLSSLSFFLCFLEEMNDGQGEMRKSAVAIIARGESVAFLSRLVILVFGRRARLFLDSLWMMMMMMMMMVV